ncbi:MAG: hypothetical protein DRP55_02540 [Spirochaetes bacterium]|nr:class I SAM-dependent methyltransferase [Deltaproteobacteria bacterium]RKY02701.1 MAG: hypothetical protein DRP55_02540 [Spirochaetota bacterium]
MVVEFEQYVKKIMPRPIKERLKKSPFFQKIINKIRKKDLRLNSETYQKLLEQEAKEWSSFDREKLKDEWCSHLEVSKYINFLCSGSPYEAWWDYLKKEYNHFEKAASLGAGDLTVEEILLVKDLCGQIDCFDIAEEAMKKGKENSRFPDRLNIHVTDCNFIELPPNHYDFILVHHAFHHLQNLEHVADEIKKSLKPGGIFALNDFIGESYFQWSDEKIKLANEIIKSFPDIDGDPNFKSPCVRPSLSELKNFSPFEAIRSQEILDVLKKRFTCIKQVKYGGLLYVTIQGKASKFKDIPEMNSFIRLLCVIDSLCEKLGLLQAFTFSIYKKV